MQVGMGGCQSSQRGVAFGAWESPRRPAGCGATSEVVQVGGSWVADRTHCTHHTTHAGGQQLVNLHPHASIACARAAPGNATDMAQWCTSINTRKPQSMSLHPHVRVALRALCVPQRLARGLAPCRAVQCIRREPGQGGRGNVAGGRESSGGTREVCTGGYSCVQPGP